MLDRSCYAKSMENKRKKLPTDVNQLAKYIVDLSTSEKQKPVKEKNPAAVALGRLGGLKGGKARAEKLSAKKRKEIASKAAKSRWAKK
jgi:hypothetical protein